MAVIKKREGRQDLNPGRPLRVSEVIRGAGAGLIIVALVAAALFAYRGGALAAFVKPAPPEVIILVVADAMRADRLPCYGYTAGRAPNISSLARDGVLYQHSSAQSAWTKSSVATILTSLYPSTHRVLLWDDVLPDEVHTLPEILSANGYHTAGFIANTALSSQFNFQQGFAEYYDLDPLESAFVYQGERLYQEAERVNWRVLPWLEAHRDQRFFLYLHYMDPHGPYFVHPYDGRGYSEEDPALAPLESDVYDGEITYFDEHFGRLIATLKRLDLYDKALIVFTADHGEEFYEHQGWKHSKTLYQEITHVPLIIKYPANQSGLGWEPGPGAGTVDEGLARGLDVAPTILDVAGIAPPPVMRGVSLRLPADSPARAQFSYAEVLGDVDLMAVQGPRYKLIEVIDGDLRGRAPMQLYDLEADPGETVNLAEARPDIVAQLQAEMSRTVALAERAAIVGQKAQLDPAFRERLKRLGY